MRDGDRRVGCPKSRTAEQIEGCKGLREPERFASGPVTRADRPSPGQAGNGRTECPCISPTGADAPDLSVSRTLKSFPQFHRSYNKPRSGIGNIRRSVNLRIVGKNMSDTHVLLNKIASLRQRLEQAQGLAGEAVASLTAGPATGRLGRLEQQVHRGAEHDALMDGSLRQITPASGTGCEGRLSVTQLTARYRRLLERGRDLLGRLRGVRAELDLLPDCGPQQDDPLLGLYRETAAMADTSLRPDSGLSGCAQRGAAALCRFGDKPRTSRRPYSPPDEGGARPPESRGAHRVACGVAHRARARGPVGAPVVRSTWRKRCWRKPSARLRCIFCTARLNTRPASWRVTVSPWPRSCAWSVHDPELRGRQIEPVLAALLHDAGMLRVPAEILAQNEPAGRRSATCARRPLPTRRGDDGPPVARRHLAGRGGERSP